MNSKYGRGTDPLEEDWDNLIILDACRFDTFVELNNLPGELEARFSVASATMEWLEKTVAGKTFFDTVYLTANPRVNRYENNFFDVVPAWKSHWDGGLNVVPPNAMTNIACDLIQKYPHKRLVIHYMQPHIPFIGEFGQSEIGIHDGTRKGVNRATGQNVKDTEYTEPYNLLEQEKINKESVKKAYRENLEIVLPEIERLLDSLEGKTVVTSDHGEMFGEIGYPTPFRIYGHELRIPAKDLLEIPWLTVNDSTRRKIIEETVAQSSRSINDSDIDEKLRHLGYKQ
jgi:hypothetical protein